ncbi:MAG: FAD:protein FMN transferase [Micrococcales bacterium]|nr:FAD:protein FMN transferase [Micrococcales bacterium]
MQTAEIPVRIAPAGITQAPSRKAWVEQLMGMPISIHVKAIDVERPEIRAAVANAFDHLRQVDRVFSAWRADSDLLRMRRGELAVEDAHPWLTEVIDLCAEAELRTGGLFTSTLPDPSGQDPTGELFFDPTGLVKGWAIAGAAAYLQTLHQVSFCVNAGGDLLVGTGRGMDRGTDSWRVGVQDPLDGLRLARVLTVSEGAVATSGTAARGAHVLDPATGRRITRPGSATVYGPDIMWADIWATALFVDPVRGAALMGTNDPDYASILL